MIDTKEIQLNDIHINDTIVAKRILNSTIQDTNETITYSIETLNVDMVQPGGFVSDGNFFSEKDYSFKIICH